MKLTILILTALAVSGIAQAEKHVVHQFTCVTDKPVEYKDSKKPSQVIKPTEFSFAVENLDSSKPGYWTTEDDDDPVTMKPDNSVLDLNENGSIQVGAKGLELSSDGDGCQYTTVVLYRDKEFKKGYVRVDASKTGCGGDDVYSTVTCKVTVKK